MKNLFFVLFATSSFIAAPAWSQNAPKPVVQEGVSLGALLQLQPAQNTRLSQLYNGFDSRRKSQEARVASGQISSAAARLATEKDWKAMRVKARDVLPPVQLSQLDSVASDPRFRVRQDFLYGLLLAPTFDASGPQNASARRNWLDARQQVRANELNRARGIGSYGVYGGYGGGGPQAGVYGGYQQGPVGVHAGVGLGGPSIGISVGRVFGIGRR